MADEYRKGIKERMDNPNKKIPLSEILHASIPYDQYLVSAQYAYREKEEEED